MVAGLVTLAAEAAVIGVIAGMLLAWGLTGGDGGQAHPVPSLLGLVLFGGTVATTAVVIGLLDGWTGPAVAATVLAVTAGATVWLSWQPAERDRRPLYWTLVVVALLLPIVVASVGDAHPAALRHLVIAAIAPVALALSAAPPWGDGALRRDPMMLAGLLVLATPLCLLSTTLLA